MCILKVHDLYMVLFICITCPLKGLCTVLHTTSVQQRNRGLGLAPFCYFQPFSSYLFLLGYCRLAAVVKQSGVKPVSLDLFDTISLFRRISAVIEWANEWLYKVGCCCPDVLQEKPVWHIESLPSVPGDKAPFSHNGLVMMSPSVGMHVCLQLCEPFIIPLLNSSLSDTCLPACRQDCIIVNFPPLFQLV